MKTRGVQKSALLNPSLTLGGAVLLLERARPMCLMLVKVRKMEQNCDLGISGNLTTGDKSGGGVV